MEKRKMSFEEAVRTALAEVKNAYAQAYLREIDIGSEAYGAETMKTQLFYCLKNMKSYEGETARAVKKAFKRKLKELGG